MKSLPGELGYRNEMGGLVQGASDETTSHVLTFARSSVGVVRIKGALRTLDCARGPARMRQRNRRSLMDDSPDSHRAPAEWRGRRRSQPSGGAHQRPGRNLTLRPRGAPIRFLAQGSIEFGQVFLPDALLNRASEAEGLPALSGRLREDLSFVPERAFDRLTFDYLRRAFDRIVPATSLEMEGRALLLVDRLVKLHQSPRIDVLSQVGGLSAQHLRRTCDFIRDHLGEDITLDELAGLTGLSCKHFTRAFKQSTGLPPHRFVILQRMEAAKRRLLNGKASLSEIALECGFADHSHFTATFRKMVGIPPGVWRRQQAK